MTLRRQDLGQAGRFGVQRLRGTPEEVHAVEPTEPARAEVWMVEVTHAALVLGSAQRHQPPPALAADLDVVHRRSGGGAVLVEPGDLVWIDVVLPTDDPRHHQDVTRAFWWLGETWVEALADVGVVGDVHRGPLRRTPWSDLVCFAGLGPGEVTIDGAKVIGISQRRTRGWTRFQCACLLHWRPRGLLGLVPDEAIAALADVASGLAPGVGPDRLVEAFLARMAGR